MHSDISAMQYRLHVQTSQAHCTPYKNKMGLIFKLVALRYINHNI